MGKQIQRDIKVKTAVGYTYRDWNVESKGGTVIHSPIWRNVGAFRQMNPGHKPEKVRITIETEE